MQFTTPDKKCLQWLAGFAILRLVLPFFLQNSFYQPHRDEFLYLDYARHMDWGYMEVPPMLSIFSWLTWKLGNTHFWVKFWPALFGSLTFSLCGHLVLKLGGRLYALILLFCAFLFGAYIRLFFLFQPGFLEVFSWTAILYCLISYHLTNQKKWIYLFGLMCGIGLLSKYTTAFLICGLIGGLLITPARKIFIQKPFYLAGLIGFLLFLPNLAWQYNHNFPVVFHMKELRETQLVNIGATDFLMGQLFMNLVFAFVWITGLIALLFLKYWKPIRWMGFTYILTITLLIAGSAKDYYALGLYPILLAIGSIQIERALSRKPAFLKAAIVIIPTLAGLFILPLGLPMFKPEKLAAYYEKNGFTKTFGFKWEDQKNHPLPQDFADMMGWKEIAEMAARNYNRLPDSTRKQTVVFCRGYYTAGALNFYGKKPGLPEAISDNGSYLLWIPADFNFKHLMLIGHRNPGPDDIVFNHFEKRSVMDSIQMPLFREHGIKVYFFENGSDSMRYYASEGIRLEKAKFTR